MNRKAGIYAIRHIPSKRNYVGSSNDIPRRWAEHLRDFRSGKHCNRRLLNAWRKYGAEQFQLIVLEETFDLIAREQFWIDKLDAIGHGFNLAPIAGRTAGLKYTHSAEEKARRSHRWKELMADPERGEHYANRMRGNSYSAGYKFTEEKRTELRTLKQTPEWRAAHSERMKQVWARKKGATG